MNFKIKQVIIPKCNISLQEYQSKKLLEDNGLNVQRFQIASTPEQAYEAGKSLSKLLLENMKYVKP